MHHQPVLIELQIFDIQTHQLRPPERPGETHQHERPIPNVESAVGIEARGDGAKVLHLDRALAGLGGAESPPNSFHQLADHGRLGGRVESGGLVRLGDSRDAPGEGRNFVLIPPGWSNKAPRFRAGREEQPVIRLAPGGEVSPVGSVGAPGIWGERMAEKLLGARNGVVQGEFPALAWA